MNSDETLESFSRVLLFIGIARNLLKAVIDLGEVQQKELQRNEL